MSCLRCLSSIVVLGGFCCVSALQAQVAAVAPRIVGPVDDATLVTLKGSVSSLTRPQFDHGAASPTATIPYARFVLSRAPSQEAALERFMAQQIDPSSPDYRHWLTPSEFGKLYGPSDSDIAAIVGWLQTRGFKIENVSTGRTDIAFSGSVAQMEAVFHVNIHRMQFGGQQFLGNVNAPQIPAALAPVVSGIAGLTTFEPRPHLARGPSGHYDPQLKRLVREDATRSSSSDFTVNGTGGQYLYVVPADAATIYDTPNVYNAGFSSGTSYTGKGVAIGIGGDAAITSKVVVNYRQRFLNGDTTAPTITNIKNSAVLGGDTEEAYLDNEVAGGIAPGATIHFYTADSSQGGISAAIEQMLSDNSVEIFNLSFGECEDHLATSDNQLINSWWQQAATQGIAVTVSTGDSGSAGCDDQNTETEAVDGLAVSGFSTTPYNIAVGGTDFYGLYTSFTTYAGSNSSATNFYRSALSYIPETPWNDSSSTIGTVSQDKDFLNNGQTEIIGATGGKSTCSNNDTTFSQQGVPTYGACNSGYPKPSWQTGTGVPNDGDRDVPDVSLLAGNGFFGATWLVCSDQDQTTVGTTKINNDCSTQSTSSYDFYFDGVGGTSAAAPAFAGILALVEEKVGSRLGASVLKNLYGVFNGAQGSAAFHDITVGNISVPCQSGTPNCATNSAGDLFLTGYDTNAGYDLATGLGSVDATQLIAAYGNSGGGGGGTLQSTVTVTPASGSIDTGQSLNVSVMVSGGSGNPIPTGNVSITAGSYTSSTTLDNTGSASFTIPANSFTSSGTINASYGGDSNYGTATGTASVGLTQSSFTLPTPSNPSAISPGGTASATITVSSSNNYSGTITFTCALTSSPSGASDLPTCSAGSSVTLNSSTTSGTTTISVSTTAATSSSLDRRGLPAWFGAGGGTALAVIVFLGIPAWRRSWRNLLGLMVMMIALGTLSACGGGGGSGGGGGGGNPGTTAGNYTFTVTGTGNPAGSGTSTTTFSVTVN